MEGELRTLSSSIRFMLCPYVFIINILRRALHLTPVLYRDAHLLIHVKNRIPAVFVSLRAMSLSTGSALAQSKAGTFIQLEPVFSEVRCNCPAVARTVERSWCDASDMSAVWWRQLCCVLNRRVSTSEQNPRWVRFVHINSTFCHGVRSQAGIDQCRDKRPRAGRCGFRVSARAGKFFHLQNSRLAPRPTQPPL
jgi:hypothetical protein